MSNDSEKQEEDIVENKKNAQTSDFYSKEKIKLFSVLKWSNISNIERNKKIEKHFQNTLEAQEFKKLKTLVIDSLYRISWEKLIQDGVINIKNKKVEGIYWKEDLNLISTKVKSLWKIKKIEGWLDGGNLRILEDLGELEEIGNWGDIQGTKIKSLGKLKKVGGDLYCQNIQNLKNFGKLKKVGGTLYCKDLETLESLGDLEEVGEDLNIKGTKIKSLGKLKRVGGFLSCQNLETLESLGDLEIVESRMNIEGTKIKSLGKLKKVGGHLYYQNLETLEDLGNLEEIGEDLNIKGTKIKIQLEIIKKYKENILKIGKEIYFGGEIETIERLLEQETIPGILDLTTINIKKQLNIICKWKAGELKLNSKSVIIDKNLYRIYNKIYEEETINFNKYREVFGEDINQIEDKEMKTIGEEILKIEYKKIEKEIEKKVKQIVLKNKGKNLTDEKKKNIRKQILELDRELKFQKEKIESFGIKL